MNFILVSVLLFLNLNLSFAFDKDTDCKCRSVTKGRIIGGNAVQSQDYPFIAPIFYNNQVSVSNPIRKASLSDSEKILKHNCGSVIINERWVITSANCIADNDKVSLRVGFGSYDLIEIFDKNQFVDIEQMFFHPLYNKTSNSNNLVMVKLKKALKFSNKVQPACIGTVNVDKYDTVLSIAGFGSIGRVSVDLRTGRYEGDILPRYLIEADVYDKTDSENLCQDKEQESICVGNDNKETTCSGDEGGPLTLNIDGRLTVIGISSSHDYEFSGDKALMCTGTALFSRLSAFTDFIKEHVGENNYCG